jgi:very-short-patch-repair endonuclease
MDYHTLQEKYKCLIIKNNTQILFRASDIGKITGQKNIRNNLMTFSDDEKTILKMDTNGGKQNVLFLTEKGLCKIFMTCRKSNVINIASDFGINILRKTFCCIETDILNHIIEVFQDEEMIEQYSVLKYRIDLYFPKYKLAIECDENHHNGIQQTNEDKLREEEIIKELNCTFIRFKPYDKKFNIFSVIRDIYSFIKKNQFQ